MKPETTRFLIWRAYRQLEKELGDDGPPSLHDVAQLTGFGLNTAWRYVTDLGLDKLPVGNNAQWKTIGHVTEEHVPDVLELMEGIDYD